jgi:ADP-ribose pyrophosphatase YjhB (NUDIX family)
MQNDQILLTQREDFEVWCLPGGHINPGESFAECAIREAREETGLEVRLSRLVGSYSRPGWNEGFYHVHLFAAEIVGGTLQAQQGEVLDMRYFPFDALPEAILIGHRHRIVDAISGLTGVVKTERVEWPFPGMDRWATYDLRDDSGLSRRAFYERHFPPLTPEQIQVDTPGVPWPQG